MERPVEVVVLDRGQVRGARRLSPENERRAAIAGAVLGAGAVVAAMLATVIAVVAADWVVPAPLFFGTWLVGALAVGALSARRARARWQRFALGPQVDADAFANEPVDLVVRGPSGYELRLGRGMTGAIEGGRAEVPLQALAAPGSAAIPLPDEGRVRVEVGAVTILVARAQRAEDLGASPSFGAQMMALLGDLPRRLPRFAGVAVPAALAVSLVSAVPEARAVTELQSRHAIPKNASAWEVEKLIRARAQVQTRTLHACFDPMPIACQKAGFVGVGLSLSRDGEVLSHWVTRSTFDDLRCPVSACMAEMAARWAYEPMPQPMKIVLPIQVRRTTKPLPNGGAETAAVQTTVD